MDKATYQRMLPVFVAEAELRLDTIDESILCLARGPDDREARRLLAIAAHTIKGNASALGMREMTFEAQRIELWATLPGEGLTQAMLDGLYEARTTLRRLLAEIAADRSAVMT